MVLKDKEKRSVSFKNRHWSGLPNVPRQLVTQFWGRQERKLGPLLVPASQGREPTAETLIRPDGAPSWRSLVPKASASSSGLPLLNHQPPWSINPLGKTWAEYRDDGGGGGASRRLRDRKIKTSHQDGEKELQEQRTSEHLRESTTKIAKTWESLPESDKRTKWFYM